eukprot:5173221-Pyramimonas_sp.AAC.1
MGAPSGMPRGEAGRAQPLNSSYQTLVHCMVSRILSLPHNGRRKTSCPLHTYHGSLLGIPHGEAVMAQPTTNQCL